MEVKLWPPTYKHKKGKKTRAFIKYSVWDNKTDMPVIIDGEARECARAMDLTISSFYCTVTNVRKGIIKRWTIESHFCDEEE